MVRRVPHGVHGFRVPSAGVDGRCSEGVVLAVPPLGAPDVPGAVFVPCGSPVPLGDPPVVGGVAGRAVVAGPPVIGTSIPVVVVAASRSRSRRPTSVEVRGAGRLMLTSCATRWMAALTPRTIKAVAASHATATRSVRPFMSQACVLLCCPEVKSW